MSVAYIGRRYEGKIRYLVNDLLLYLQNLQSIFVPINKHGAQGRDNALRIEEAYASDNQIITFPAGLCSRKINGKIVDLDWKKSFIQKAVQYKRDIVPVYFDGQNSARFYRVANIRKRLGIKMNYERFICRTKCSGPSIKHFISTLANQFRGKPLLPDKSLWNGRNG